MTRLRLIEPPLGEDARPLTPEEGAELLALWDAETRRPVLAYAPNLPGVTPPCRR
jgi:hypothetical protein